MRVGIDAHHVNGKPQGSRTYLLGLIRQLAHLAPGEWFTIYSFNPLETRRLLSAPNLIHRRIFPTSPRLRLPLVVPALELIHGVQVFHSQYVCPPLSAVPEVVSIHDILFETHPDLFVGAFSSRSAWLIRRSAKRARFVLTVSEFSRQALLERYQLSEEKVVVSPDAVDPERFRPMDAGAELDELRRRYGLDAPFVLSVGRLEPRKNLERLIRAFDHARGRLDGALRLVLVGPEDFRSESIHQETQRHSGTVRWLGPVPDEDLPGLYNLAAVLAYPSLAEGFGMPLLEAMACGTPVVASRRGALPEVGGDVPFWVEPDEEDSIAQGIELALTDSEQTRRRRQAGLERAKQFQWQSTARKTLEVYRRSVD